MNDGLRHAGPNPTAHGDSGGTATALSHLAGILCGEDGDGPRRPLIAGEGVRVDRFRKDGGIWGMTSCTVDQTWVHSSFPISQEEGEQHPDAEAAT